MWRSFFTDKKWLLWSWGGFAFIILSLLAQTYIDVKIIEYYKVKDLYPKQKAKINSKAKHTALENLKVQAIQ